MQVFNFYCDTPEQAIKWRNIVINAGYYGNPLDFNNLVEKKKVMVILNPFGGAGKAPKKWAEAKEIFDLAHIDYDLRNTDKQGHAYEIMKNEVEVG